MRDSRPGALFVLLVAVLLPLIGTSVGAGLCSDDCGTACGDCLACGFVGCLTTPQELRSLSEAAAIAELDVERPAAAALRPIEHVPLRRA